MPNRWLGVVTLALVVSIAYLDRINVSLLITDREFLGIFGLQGDRASQGLLMTVFLLGYGVAAWFLTPLFEARWDVRAGLLVSLVSWAAFTGLAALSSSLAVLLVLRFALGAAEGPLFSLKTMFIAQRFSPREVGKPNAVSSLGVNIGLAAGYVIVAYLIASFGWRNSFWGLMALNAFVGVPLVLLFVAPADRSKTTAPRERDSALTLVREAMLTPHIWPVLIIEIATLSYLWGASTWLPAYFKETHHLALTQMSIYAGLPFIIGIGASLIGGAILDRMDRNRAPIMFVIGGLSAALMITLAITAGSPNASAAAIVAAGACFGLQTPAIPTLVQHISRPGAVGSAYGFINGVGNLLAAAMPLMMGAAMMSQSGENVARGFWLLVGSQVVAAACGLHLALKLRQS